MTIVVSDAAEFLKPVNDWLNGEVSETADEVIQRAVDLARQIDSINLAIHEAKTASGNAGEKTSTFFESDLFTTLNNHRDGLRRQLLALTQKD